MSSPNSSDLDSDLKNLRLQKGLTVRELANKAEVSHGHLPNWENGKEFMSKQTAKKLSNVLNTDWTYLYSVQLRNAVIYQYDLIKKKFDDGKLNQRELETEIYKLLWKISDRRLNYSELNKDLKSQYIATENEILDFLKQQQDST